MRSTGRITCRELTQFWRGGITRAAAAVDTRERPVEGHRVGRRSSLGDAPRRDSVTKSIVKVSIRILCLGSG